MTKIKDFFKQGTWFEYLNLLLATAIVYGAILYAQVYVINSDFVRHLNWAKDLIVNPQNVPAAVTSHAFWQWLVLIVRKILNSDWNLSALLLTLGCSLFSAGILFSYLRKTLRPLLAGAVTLGLMVAAPVFVIDPSHNFNNLVNGYIPTNVYHNPTILLLKPFALLQFIFSVEALSGKKANWIMMLVTVLCSLAAAYAKPNYILCLLPALCVIALFLMLKKQPVDWKWLLFGIAVPSLLILGWQYLITFNDGSDSGIIFAPLAMMKIAKADYLLPKYLLSILFPLVVTILHWKEAITDRNIQLGWLGFAIGSILVYFFAESGGRFGDANFYWSAEISLFILFVGCVLFLAEKKQIGKNVYGRWAVLVAAFAHIACGLVFYFYLIWSGFGLI